MEINNTIKFFRQFTINVLALLASDSLFNMLTELEELSILNSCADSEMPFLYVNKLHVLPVLHFTELVMMFTRTSEAL